MEVWKNESGLDVNTLLKHSLRILRDNDLGQLTTSVS